MASIRELQQQKKLLEEQKATKQEIKDSNRASISEQLKTKLLLKKKEMQRMHRNVLKLKRNELLSKRIY